MLRIRNADLDPILEELEKDGRIRKIELETDKKELPKQAIISI